MNTYLLSVNIMLHYDLETLWEKGLHLITLQQSNAIMIWYWYNTKIIKYYYSWVCPTLGRIMTFSNNTWSNQTMFFIQGIPLEHDFYTMTSLLGEAWICKASLIYFFAAWNHWFSADMLSTSMFLIKSLRFIL